jgi:hypothetical protein
VFTLGIFSTLQENLIFQGYLPGAVCYGNWSLDTQFAPHPCYGLKIEPLIRTVTPAANPSPHPLQSDARRTSLK